MTSISIYIRKRAHNQWDTLHALTMGVCYADGTYICAFSSHRYSCYGGTRCYNFLCERETLIANFQLTELALVHSIYTYNVFLAKYQQSIIVARGPEVPYSREGKVGSRIGQHLRIYEKRNLRNLSSMTKCARRRVLRHEFL